MLPLYLNISVELVKALSVCLSTAVNAEKEEKEMTKHCKKKERAAFTLDGGD